MKTKFEYRAKKWTEDGRKWVVEQMKDGRILKRWSFDSEALAKAAMKKMSRG